MFRFSNNYCELVCSTEACATPGRICSTSHCAFIGRSYTAASATFRRVLPQDVSAVLHYSSSWKHIACCLWTFLFYSSLCCPWTYLFYSRLCCLDVSFLHNLCCLEVSFLQQLVLFWSCLAHSSPCNFWTCLFYRSNTTLCCP
jgi:hypothetical protein